VGLKLEAIKSDIEVAIIEKRIDAFGKLLHAL
jgi:hypothetical protein